MRAARSLRLLAGFIAISLALACGAGGGGAGDDSSTTPTGSPTPTNGNFHPAGYADPTVHGPDLKTQATDCRTCHGANLDGGTSGISCDTCHQAGWRTNCTYCHGGTDNQTGAPPADLDGTTTKNQLSFSAHTKHVTADSVHVAYDCTMCHAKPADVLSTNHIFDATHGLAEVTFANGGGLNPNGQYLQSQQCATLWCHGDGEGDDGAYDGHFASTGCNSCHHSDDGQYTSMSGQHSLHMGASGQNIRCDECHATSVNASNAILDVSKHINRVRETSFPSGVTWNPSTRKCNGSCHAKGHSNLTW